MKTEKFTIESPNTSGQGFSPLASLHPLNPIALRFGYAYSHSVNVGQIGGGWDLWHCYKRAKHNVSFPESGKDTSKFAWETSISCASSHKWNGQFASQLEKHLANKAKRYPELR